MSAQALSGARSPYMRAVAAHRAGPPSLFGQSSHAEFTFARDPGGRTYLRRQFTPYPFHICRSTYVEKDPPGMATLYVQSCSAGLLQHDDLRTSLTVEQGAQAHFTTGAQTIVHSMDEGEAGQEFCIEARQCSLVEYLPEPLILFPQSRLRSRLSIVAHEGAAVLAGESFIVHDYAGEGRMFDWYESEMTVRRPDGAVVARDRFHLAGATLAAGLPGVNGRYSAQGTLIALAGDGQADSVVAAVRTALGAIDGVYAGASALRGGVGAWARLLAVDGLALSVGMVSAWAAVREALTGRLPMPRRK